jgi:hypothetical protein
VSPRRFTAPAVGGGGCRQADLRGRGFHGRGLRGAAWGGADSRGVRDRVVRCRAVFWSGLTKDPGRGHRGADPSGADA